jgi:hypothetical protein
MENASLQKGATIHGIAYRDVAGITTFNKVLYDRNFHNKASDKQTHILPNALPNLEKMFDLCRKQELKRMSRFAKPLTQHPPFMCLGQR